MITKDEAILISNKANKERHPEKKYEIEGVRETKTAYHFSYRNWGFHMNTVNKETGEVILDDSRLYLNDQEFWDAPYVEL